MSRNGKLMSFLPFLDTFGSKIRENVSRNRRNDKKCLETRENVSRNRRNDKKFYIIFIIFIIIISLIIIIITLNIIISGLMCVVGLKGMKGEKNWVTVNFSQKHLHHHFKKVFGSSNIMKLGFKQIIRSRYTRPLGSTANKIKTFKREIIFCLDVWIYPHYICVRVCVCYNLYAWPDTNS